jgi:hypothetical protein
LRREEDENESAEDMFTPDEVSQLIIARINPKPANFQSSARGRFFVCSCPLFEGSRLYFNQGSQLLFTFMVFGLIFVIRFEIQPNQQSDKDEDLDIHDGVQNIVHVLDPFLLQGFQKTNHQ